MSIVTEFALDNRNVIASLFDDFHEGFLFHIFEVLSFFGFGGLDGFFLDVDQSIIGGGGLCECFLFLGRLDRFFDVFTGVSLASTSACERFFGVTGLAFVLSALEEIGASSGSRG